MEPEQDARTLWVSIKALFQANKQSRAVVLEQKFHNLLQGDLSIDAYAQQMKRTADALREIGHTVSPAQLMLNLLRGLNPRFANTADISNTSPLPDFKAATNMLPVKEIRLGTEGNAASASALAASTTSTCMSPSCQSTPSASTNRGGGGKGKGSHGGNGGGNGGGGSSGGGHHQQQGGNSAGGRN